MNAYLQNCVRVLCCSLSPATVFVFHVAALAAIKSVPPSIREAALGVGASKFQTTLHHVLPLSLPAFFKLLSTKSSKSAFEFARP